MQSIRRVLPAVLLAFVLSLSAETPPRNWGRCPAVVTLETPQIVYALGDTHGDRDRMAKLLAAGKLIANADGDPQWTAGRSVLVITGDMIDKWPHSLEVIAFVRALTSSAASQGGRVIVSAGNHEAEFLENPTGTKTKEFQDELTKAGIKPKDVANGTDAEGIGKFLLCLPFATRVNDWFFAHAGSTKGRTLTQLIGDLQQGIDSEGYGAKVLLGNKGLLEARMKPPWWEKEGDEPIESIARLQSYADALGVHHIVFGHQPGSYTFNNGTSRKKGKLFENFDGLVFLIDTGMSRGVDSSKGALLRIENDRAVEILSDGSENPVWP